MRRLAQSTSRVVTFAAFLSSDHISIATGKTIAVTISKNGGAFANPNAGATNATEIGSTGIYKVTLDTTDTNTLGDLWVHGAVATIDNVDFICDVVSATTAGASNLDAAVSTRASQSSVDTIDDFVDTEVAAIKAKTDNLPSDPADASDIAAAFATVNSAIGAIPTAIENADTLLDRNMATGTDSSSDSVRTLRSGIRTVRNKWTILSGIFTSYKEDDTTVNYTSTLGGTAGADPITSSDPAGP